MRREIAGRLLHAAGLCINLGFRAFYRRARGRDPRGPQLVRELLERLGGAFIKFGQVLSLQAEMLPRVYCDALLDLLDNVPSFGTAGVQRVFREEFGSLPETLFENFDYVPIASASIGQVHVGRLADGTRAAIKVQRPDIDWVFERDNLLLEGMVRLIVAFRLRGLYFLRESVRELSTWTRDELDYRREASYCQYLAENARDIEIEKIPRVYWEYTTSRVLVTELLEGPSVAGYFRLMEAPLAAGNGETLARLLDAGFVPATFTANIIRNFFRDTFLCGAFHADLHPANLLILPGNVVGYVDFGIVAFVMPETRRKLVNLVVAYATGDIAGIHNCLLEICTLEDDADLAAMRWKIEEIAPDWYQQPAIQGRVRFRVSATKTFVDLFAICRRYGVLLDREMVRFIRSVFYIDGLVSRLASSVDLADSMRDAVETWERREARRKASSAGTALVLTTEALLWARAGPSGVLRSLEALNSAAAGSPRRQRPSDPGARRRAQTMAITSTWFILTLALVSGALVPDARHHRFQAVSAGIIVLTWTAWMARSLRRNT